MGFENLDHWNTHFRIDDLKILQTFDLWLWPVTTWSWPMYIMTWSWPNLKVTFRMGELDKIATNVFLHIKPSVKIWWNLFLAAWVDHVTGNQSWNFLKITEKKQLFAKTSNHRKQNSPLRTRSGFIQSTQGTATFVANY